MAVAPFVHITIVYLTKSASGHEDGVHRVGLAKAGVPQGAAAA